MAQTKFQEEEISFSGKFSRQVFQTIARSFAEFKMRVIFLFIFGVMGRAVLLFGTNVMGYWADSMCRAPAKCKPVPDFFTHYGNHDFVNALIVLASIGFGINTIFRVAISRTGSRAVSTLYDEVTMRTSRLPMIFFDATPIGRIVTRFSSDYAAIFRMAGGPLGEFLCLFFDLVLMFILTTMASPYFLPVLIIVVALNFWVYRVSNVGLRIERRSLSRQRGPGIAHFAETVQGASTIKVFGKRKSFIHRYDLLMGDYLLQKIQTAIAVNGFSFKMTTITALMLLVTGMGGIWMANSGLVSVGSLAVAFTFIMMTSSTIQQFFEWLASLEEALTGIERMDEYLHRPLELGARMPRDSLFSDPSERSLTHVDLEAFKVLSPAADATSRIVINDLTMRYRADLPPILKKLNLTIEPKEQFAVIGRTGSGKSSFIQALFCLYPPESGSVSIGGMQPDYSLTRRPLVDLQRDHLVPIAEYRRRMALIPQDPNLFQGTIRENLGSLATDQDGRLWRILEEVGVAPWIRSLSGTNGFALDFRLEEGAKNISLGERQLLCMARALLQDTPIIIMDEATSAVDPASEELLVRATKTQMAEKTRIIVAHRLSTIESSDRVLWLDQGEIKMLDRPDVVLPKFRETDLTRE